MKEPPVQPEPIEEMPSEADLQAEVDLLRRELLAVHDELTRQTAERQALSGRLSALTLDIPGGALGALKGRAREIRRRGISVVKDAASGRLGPKAALIEALRIGYDQLGSVPAAALAEMIRLRRAGRERRYAGAGPLTSLDPKEMEGPRAQLWLDLLADRYDATSPVHSAYLDELRRLAQRSGSISTSLDAVARATHESPRMAGMLAELNGRAMELSGWLPRLPGPAEPLTPARPGGRKTVLHLVKESRPYFSNGFTSRSHQNFKAEQDAGWEPVVLTEPGFPRSVVGADFQKVEVYDGIEHRRLDTGVDYAKVPADRWQEDFAWLAWQQVRQIRPDVIHVSSGRRGFETALVALALKEKTGIPVVYEVRSFFEANWTPELDLEESGEIFRRRMEVETRCMQLADHVLTLGTAMRDEIISRGIPAEKVSLVPNAVNLENFRPAPRDPELADRYGITMPTFGYVSNMDHRREGQDYLIEAAARLKERGIEAQCVLVGGGGRLRTLQGLAARWDVEDRVVFTGPVDHAEISSLYALIDVFVVPRIHERAAEYVTPLKPFEAMAMERPVVVSDLPALTEIVEAPARGRTFRAEDVDSLADVVAELLADPAERERLGRAGRTWIEDERQWKHNGPRYAEVFDRLSASAVGEGVSEAARPTEGA
ncbi:glycosyltransferase family 4 protein [Citricoccus sp. GCM10030269]|uniref:glycosyltransferase family 4 protein n=1 Tax=Citricoccus sp. GCM10030269 TaxID=3273388 RepID=UPI0036125553